jgi:hypothetical protein
MNVPTRILGVVGNNGRNSARTCVLYSQVMTEETRLLAEREGAS